MSGHSKWHNIKEKKSRVDNARGKVFTKISKEIHMSVKEGGPDPDNNFRLKVAIGRAKEVNMPADSIKRTIEKAAGAGSANYEELLYEGYGPCGVALIMEIATDNRNRTAAEVRNIFSRSGCTLGENGCVSWMFNKKALFQIPESQIDEDKLMDIVINAGADDMELDEGYYNVVGEPSSYRAINEALEAASVKPESSEITWIPQNTVEITEAESEKVLRLINALEDFDDVDAVYSNYEVK